MLACGTGAVTRLIIEELARRGRQAHLIAVDPSADVLQRAQQSIEAMGAQAYFFGRNLGNEHFAIALSLVGRVESSKVVKVMISKTIHGPDGVLESETLQEGKRTRYRIKKSVIDTLDQHPRLQVF